MFKTFVTGIVLGIAGVVALVMFVPLVDQARETSVVRVLPNGGNSETFHINIPIDRIAVGAPEQAQPLPPGMEWPIELDATSAELYKLRDVHDSVIGVASRVVISDEVNGDAIEWVIHLPARGSMYIGMGTQLLEDRTRSGRLISGTREFDGTSGSLSEAYVAGDGSDELVRGRIELRSRLVANGGGA